MVIENIERKIEFWIPTDKINNIIWTDGFDNFKDILIDAFNPSSSFNLIDDNKLLDKKEFNIISEKDINSKGLEKLLRETIGQIFLYNQESYKKFWELENILNDLNESIGVKKIEKMVYNGLEEKINMRLCTQDLFMDLFDYDVDVENIYLIYLNLIAIKYPQKTHIIFFEKIDAKILKWIRNNQFGNYMIYINAMYLTKDELCGNCLYTLQKVKMKKTYNIEYQFFDKLKYIFNPIVMSNFEFQNSEIRFILDKINKNKINYFLILN